jgi:flagellar hook-length control protein FliK
MQKVQFDPKIATDLPFDWRRPAAGQTDDLFADLLKRRFDTERNGSQLRRDEQTDQLSGRPRRLVIAHPKTIRGEARKVDTDNHRLPEMRDSGDGAPTEAVEQCAASEKATAATDVPAEDSGATDGGADATSDQPAQATNQAGSSAMPTPTVVAGSQSIVPDGTAMPVDPVPSEDGEKSGAATQQQALAAMVESGMVDAAVALGTGTGEQAPTDAPAPAPAMPELNLPSSAPVSDDDRPNLQIFQVPAPFGEKPVAPAPAPRARSDHASMDVKLRPGTTPQGRTGSSDSASNAAPAQSGAPHHASLAQLGGSVGEFATAEDLVAQPFSADASGPGWAHHLAQGAANRRTDFIAQLRQHLQSLPAHEQVAVHIQRALREGTGRLSVQLSPAELGRIHVKLEIDEDKRVRAAVTVERPSTLELLQRDVRGLERALHSAGLMMEGGGLSFSLGHGNDQEFAQDLGQSGASATNGLASGTESEAEQPAKPATQVTDTAAGVVNLQV